MMWLLLFWSVSAILAVLVGLIGPPEDSRRP